LIIADSQQLAIRDAQFVLQFILSLGWIPNWEKSCLTPSQCFEYVGVEYDLKRGLALPPKSRVQKINLLIFQLIDSRFASARKMLSLIGLLASVEKQVPFGRCFLRPIQWCLALQWSIMHDHLDRMVEVDDRAILAMRWWLSPVNIYKGMPLGDFIPDRTLFTDASEIAWGAHMDDVELSERWSPLERQMHINVLELKAVTLAFTRWSTQTPRGTSWLVYTDNTTVVAYINKQGGTRSLPLCLEAEALFKIAFARDQILKARHLPGKRNVLADALSRPDQILGTEWSLCPQVFLDICRTFGMPNIDLFATSKNTKLPVFCSPLPESMAYAADSMSLKWDGFFGYAYPPTGFLMEVLHKVARSRCEILLVAPLWQTQPWFPLLMNLLVDVPRSLPIHNKLLMQPGRPIYHQTVGTLRLHVWRLSSDPSRRQVFLETCRHTSLGKTVSPRHERTKPNGVSMYVGATEGVWIRSLPL
jgi:hypothetical protein